jgi:hypothetical protein
VVSEGLVLAKGPSATRVLHPPSRGDILPGMFFIVDVEVFNGLFVRQKVDLVSSSVQSL